jgi:phage anti-repressor protein
MAHNITVKRENLIFNHEVKNQDESFTHGGKREGAGRKAIGYFLTVDCFKAFCMMAGTSKGKEVRLYYLKIEKAWNTLEAVMARAQQMGATLNWKEPSAAKMVVQLRAYNQGLMTPNEYRRKVLNLPPFEIDAPLERPGKEARKTKTEPEEKYYPSDELLKFVDNNLDFTSSSDDFIRLADLYDRYVLQVETPLSRWTFIHTLKGSFNIISRQKKIGGYPTLVFVGCKFKPLKEPALLNNK